MASSGRTALLLACALASAAARPTPPYHIQLPRGHVVTSLLASATTTTTRICKAVEGATASDDWCAKSCTNAPAVCPPEICKCTESAPATLAVSPEATEAEKENAKERVKAKEEKAKQEEKAAKEKTKAAKEKSTAAESAAAEAQGASKQMSFQEMVNVKKAKDSLPEAPAPKAESKPKEKDHKPKDLDQKVAELNEKGEERMKMSAYTNDGAFGALREPTDQEKEVARKRAALLDPAPASVGIAPVVLAAPAAVATAPVVLVAAEGVTLRATPPKAVTAPAAPAEVAASTSTAETEAPGAVQQEQPAAAQQQEAPKEDMAAIVAKMNAAAEERNKKSGNKLEPGQLRAATAKEAAYVMATDPLVQGRGQQQNTQAAQQQEQEAKQVAPAKEKTFDQSQQEPAADEPLNKEQAAYNAMQAKAEQDLEDEAAEARKTVEEGMAKARADTEAAAQ